MDLAAGSGAAGLSGSSELTSHHVSVRRRNDARAKSLREAHIESADASYFNSYGHFDIHRTMLADKVTGPLEQ